MGSRWWAGRESNPHSRRRLIYSQRSSPPAQPTHGSTPARGASTGADGIRPMRPPQLTKKPWSRGRESPRGLPSVQAPQKESSILERPVRYAEPNLTCYRGSLVRTPSISLLLMLAVVIAACAAPESSGSAATAEPSATHVDQATPQESTHATPQESTAATESPTPSASAAQLVFTREQICVLMLT